MQDSLSKSKKSEKIPSFADRKDMKKYYDALKTIYAAQNILEPSPLLSADGSILLTEKDAIFQIWAENFNSVPNRPLIINDNSINRLAQIKCNVLFDKFPNRHRNKGRDSKYFFWQSPRRECFSCRGLLS